MGWDDVADLNYDNTAMRAAMQEAMLYWLTEADVDGFRCDHAEGVPNDFWKETITKLRAAKSTFADAGRRFHKLHSTMQVLICCMPGTSLYKLQDVYAGSAFCG